MVEIRSLNKSFGRRKAVDNFNLTIEQGEIFGLVGPNGAGKTTTMRMLVTLLKPDQGEIAVGGFSVEDAPREVRRLIGFMPDNFGVYGEMTVQEYLDFFAACYNIPAPQRARLINDLLELVDISHRRDDMVDTLSRGLKQRLGIARVLIHDPSLLVLDEPASGLDPRARIEIRELLLEIARLGKTILFSSHILADVAELCSRVGIMESGKLVALGTLDQLHQRLLPHRLVHVALLNTVPPEDARAVLANLPGVSSVRLREGFIRADWIMFEAEFLGDDEALRSLLAALLEKGLPVVHFSEETQDLEEVFMRATRGIVS
ncbi:MAG: ABC transporter ATP-binding protein [Chloroflexi bacterium]|nr:ABC transporter ATP-binding protein [Chloroflexota bacterium]MDL1940867.1 ABC transporter ATP-binding protein [Chloroflexi bacterium CFX2]